MKTTFRCDARRGRAARAWHAPLIAALGLLAVGATGASAQYGGWNKAEHPYLERNHEYCQRTGRELHRMELMEREHRGEHRGDRRDRMRMAELERDMRARCGAWRYHG